MLLGIRSWKLEARSWKEEELKVNQNQDRESEAIRK